MHRIMAFMQADLLPSCDWSKFKLEFSIGPDLHAEVGIAAGH
jgi:hypothetical protein